MPKSNLGSRFICILQSACRKHVSCTVACKDSTAASTLCHPCDATTCASGCPVATHTFALQECCVGNTSHHTPFLWPGILSMARELKTTGVTSSKAASQVCCTMLCRCQQISAAKSDLYGMNVLLDLILLKPDFATHSSAVECTDAASILQVFLILQHWQQACCCTVHINSMCLKGFPSQCRSSVAARTAGLTFHRD